MTFDAKGGIHPLVGDITSNLYLYKSWLVGWNDQTSIHMERPAGVPSKDLIDKNLDTTWREKVESFFEWYFNPLQNRAQRAPLFLTGSIASSNSLVRNYAILAKWLQAVRSIRAVEMESAGVYQAAQHILQQYPVMAIRGISDIIGLKRDDNWKLYACHTAAAFAHAFIVADIIEPRASTASSSGRTPADVPILLPIRPSNSSQENADMPIKNNATQNSLNANTIKIFTIYADADKLHKERLATQLSPYIWNQLMDLWDRDRINPSAELIQQEIDNHIDSSQVILLLVSPHFPASKQCLTEMERAMQRRTTSKTIIIPIYIRPTDWPEAPFEGLLALPRNGKPVSSWSNADDAWHNVAVDIRKACEGLRKPQSNL
jgi:hypothetical protein